MYFKITRAFLKQRTKEDLIDIFNHIKLPARLSKIKLITAIQDSWPKHLGMEPWLLICPYCRATSYFAGTGTPKFCSRCARTSPIYSHENNIMQANHLVILATDMKKKEQQLSKKVLLEQAVVALITGLEVLMREAYSLGYDLSHILVGRSIYEDIYARTRNVFLNLGSASRELRKVTNLNIKKEMSTGDYKYLSRMYSARHIIVHNSAIKDREFINQTGSSESELGHALILYIADLRRLIRISHFLSRRISKELQISILTNHHFTLSISRSIISSTKKKRNSKLFDTSCDEKLVVFPVGEKK